MAYNPNNPNGQATKANSQPVTLASDQELSLPTGASTSAKQDTGNTSVASIDTKTPALGQALAAASVPVVLTAAQITTLTPPAAITGFATSAKQDTQITAEQAIQTSVQLIDDVIKTDDAAFTPATDKVAMIGAQADETGTDSVDEGDAGALRMTLDRQLYVKVGTALPAGTNNIGDVDVLSSALPTGAATSALQTQPGVDIGDVTVNNASGASAVNIQDGGNSITVDYATTGSGTATGALRVELPTNGTGTIASITTSVTPGTAAANLGKAEDAAYASGDTGVAVWAVRNDTGAALAGTTGDYIPFHTNGTGDLWIAPKSILSTANSTTSVLAGGATFTGTSEEVMHYASITVSVITSHISATDGLSIQQSSDGTNWDITDTYTIAASTGRTFSFQPAARYFRIVYTNGATLQTSFRLQTIFHTVQTKTSSQRPGDAYTNETDLEQVQSFLMGYNGTTWDRLRSDTTNGLDVDVTRSALPAGASTLAEQQTQTTALQLLDDTVATLGTTTYTEATTKGNIIGAVRRDANTSLVDTTNEVAPLQVNSTGELKVVQIQALPAGTNAIGKLAANSGVDIGDVDVTTVGTITPGTAATSLGKAEDAAHASGDVGVMSLGVRQDTLASLAGTTGDYEPYSMDSIGAVYTRDTATQIDDAAFTPATGRVLPVGFLADETSTDSVDEGDAGIARMTLDRKQVVANYAHGSGGYSIATGSIAATKTDIGTANTPGTVGGWYFYNANASVAYVQFFNAQASAVTLGTTAPVYSIGIPATSAANLMSPTGLAHATAISIAVTTTRAGATGPASTVDYNVFYKQ